MWSSTLSQNFCRQLILNSPDWDLIKLLNQFNFEITSLQRCIFLYFFPLLLPAPTFPPSPSFLHFPLRFLPFILSLFLSFLAPLTLTLFPTLSFPSQVFLFIFLHSSFLLKSYLPFLSIFPSLLVPPINITSHTFIPFHKHNFPTLSLLSCHSLTWT